MKQENLKEFMDHINVLNKDMSEYEDKEKGIKYLVPNSYIFARCDYLELTNEELKKEQFNQTIEKTNLKFNYIDSTRPAPKYEITKREEDKYTIIDAKVKVNQIWLVTNGLKYNKAFNNKEEALEFVDVINNRLKEYM